MTATARERVLTALAGLDVPRPIRWSEDGEAVELLDQTRLPGEERCLRLETGQEIVEAIRGLQVRGAPAIGVAGAMGLTLGVGRAIREGLEGEELAERFRELRESLLAARPTGRNLAWAVERMERAFRGLRACGPVEIAAGLRGEADEILALEAEACFRIGQAGLTLVPDEGAGILTHCNAGALATCGIGTATAPIYLAHARGIPVAVLAPETRPVLQGARLTAFELARAGVDVTVTADLASATMMKDGRVDLVLVGADRVAANGDVANKIGTYALAVLADYHGIPFYVAAPRSTFDGALASGTEIPIEERAGEEIRSGREGAVVPAGARVRNPAFDVTPAHLVTAFLTDGGVLRPPYGPAIAALLEPLGPDTSQESP